MLASVTKYIPYPAIAHAGGQYVLAQDRALADDFAIHHFAPDTPVNRDARSRSSWPLSTLLRGVGPGGRGGAKLLWDVESAWQGSAVPWPWRRLFSTERAPWRELAAAEIIEFHWSEMIALAPRVRARLPEARLIGVAHDVITQRWERAASQAANPLLRAGYRLAARRSARREAASFAALDVLIVFSDKDAALVERLRPGTTVEVVHPGLGPETTPERSPNPSAPVVLFTGALNRADNHRGAQWFLDEVWSRVAAAVPESRFVIAGANPPESLERSARAAGAEVTGFVDSLEPWYAGASVFVAPLHTGAGVKFKTLDAMLRAVPIVSTPVGAEGIDARDLFAAVTDDPVAFADAVIAELREPDAERTERARAWAEHVYGQEAFGRRVRGVYAAVRQAR